MKRPKQRHSNHAGALDETVYISVPTGYTEDAVGFRTRTYAAEVAVYANVKELDASRERDVNGGILYDELLSIKIRYDADYKNPECKLRYGSKTYDIINVREPDNTRRQWLILKCKYGGKEL